MASGAAGFGTGVPFLPQEARKERIIEAAQVSASERRMLCFFMFRDYLMVQVLVSCLS